MHASVMISCPSGNESNLRHQRFQPVSIFQFGDYCRSATVGPYLENVPPTIKLLSTNYSRVLTNLDSENNFVSSYSYWSDYALDNKYWMCHLFLKILLMPTKYKLRSKLVPSPNSCKFCTIFFSLHRQGTCSALIGDFGLNSGRLMIPPYRSFATGNTNLQWLLHTIVPKKEIPMGRWLIRSYDEFFFIFNFKKKKIIFFFVNADGLVIIRLTYFADWSSFKAKYGSSWSAIAALYYFAKWNFYINRCWTC